MDVMLLSVMSNDCLMTIIEWKGRSQAPNQRIIKLQHLKVSMVNRQQYFIICQRQKKKFLISHMEPEEQRIQETYKAAQPVTGHWPAKSVSSLVDTLVTLPDHLVQAEQPVHPKAPANPTVMVWLEICVLLERGAWELLPSQN